MRMTFAIFVAKKIIFLFQSWHITNLDFTFFFFFFLEGIRPSVWETSHISVGGRIPTDVNYAIIRNQVRFIDIVNFFQQSW